MGTGKEIRITRAQLVRANACEEGIARVLGDLQSIRLSAALNRLKRGKILWADATWAAEELGLTVKLVSETGFQQWYRKGKIHRKNGPAIIAPGGKKRWYRNGYLHRTDGPAQTDPDGYEAWYLFGKRHREDGPAVTFPNGIKLWYRNGERIR